MSFVAAAAAASDRGVADSDPIPVPVPDVLFSHGIDTNLIRKLITTTTNHSYRYKFQDHSVADSDPVSLSRCCC